MVEKIKEAVTPSAAVTVVGLISLIITLFVIQRESTQYYIESESRALNKRIDSLSRDIDEMQKVLMFFGQVGENNNAAETQIKSTVNVQKDST